MDGSGKTTRCDCSPSDSGWRDTMYWKATSPAARASETRVRRILLDSANQELCPTAELLLYFACRAQNVDEWILPALRQGQVVLSDRFTDSTLVYQGVGRAWARMCPEPGPDRLPRPGAGYDAAVRYRAGDEPGTGPVTKPRRAGKRRSPETRMDDQEVDFHRRVREAYAELAAAEPRRFTVIDGRPDVETVARAVWEAVKGRLTRLHV